MYVPDTTHLLGANFYLLMASGFLLGAALFHVVLIVFDCKAFNQLQQHEKTAKASMQSDDTKKLKYTCCYHVVLALLLFTCSYLCKLQHAEMVLAIVAVVAVGVVMVRILCIPNAFLRAKEYWSMVFQTTL